MATISQNITRLVNYAVARGLIEECDRAYATNALLAHFGLSDYTEEAVEDAPLEQILCEVCDYAAENGLIPENTVTYRDLFDTSVMGILTPRPSEVIGRFTELYKVSPEMATDYFYALSRDCDYIRTYRVAKDMRWSGPSP